MNQNQTKRYWAGDAPIPDIDFTVFKIVDEQFVQIGTITVTGKEVGDEMDTFQSIKGHMHQHIAQRKAEAQFDANPVIVIRKDFGENNEVHD
jgi:hypothetical protein